MEMARKHHQSDRSDPVMVALWYAIFIVGFPIRLALNYTVPCPDAATLRFLRWASSTAATAVILSLVGLFLLILLFIGLSIIEPVWSGLSETTGLILGRVFIALLVMLFGGLIVTTGLHGYLKNFPSSHTDD